MMSRVYRCFPEVSRAVYLLFFFFWEGRSLVHVHQSCRSQQHQQETAVYQYTPDDIAVMDMSLLPPKNEERKRRALQAEGKGVIELVRK